MSIRFSRLEELDEVLPPEDFRREPIPWAAAFLAGKVSVEYRTYFPTVRLVSPD